MWWHKVTHGRGSNWRMEWVASTLHTTSEQCVFSITTADAHTSAASSRLKWRPRRFKWTHPFRRKTKSGFCACAIIFQQAPNQLGWPMYRYAGQDCKVDIVICAYNFSATLTEDFCDFPQLYVESRGDSPASPSAHTTEPPWGQTSDTQPIKELLPWKEYFSTKVLCIPTSRPSVKTENSSA